MYWIHKLHTNPYKQCYIAGSAKYTTKPLSKLLTTIHALTAVIKDGLQFYHDTCYSPSNINYFWIWKNQYIFLKPSTEDYYQNAIALKPGFFNFLYFYFPYSVIIPTQKHYTSLLHIDTDM